MQRQTGRPPAGLLGPPRPPGSDAVWRAFGELDAQRQFSESGIPQPIQHRDVEAWCRTMRVSLHPAEIVAVLALDGERRAVEAERLAARRPRDVDLEDDDP
ncbi:phage tail assembly chaperone [Roseomonas rosulenta]